MAYATAQDFESITGKTPPEEHYFEAASDMMDAVTLGRIEEGEAARKAVIYQVELWTITDEQHDILGVSGDISIGSYSGGTPPELAPRARRVLLHAGLLYVGVKMK